ncbi:MAG: CoA pyrophosphatase [Pseudomonadota bacterium]
MSEPALIPDAADGWRARLERTIQHTEFQRERELFQELNPDIATHPFFANRPRPKLKNAAVLIPVIERPSGPSVVLTVRSSEMPTHAGQIGFPGGRIQAEDATPVDAAVRETEEEIGVPRGAVSVVGSFGVHIGGIGFAVTPVVGEIDPNAAFSLCPREVAEVFEAPLAHFTDLDNHGVEWREFDGRKYRMFSAPYGDYHVWGLTAGILKTLADALNT